MLVVKSLDPDLSKGVDEIMKPHHGLILHLIDPVPSMRIPLAMLEIMLNACMNPVYGLLRLLLEIRYHQSLDGCMEPKLGNWPSCLVVLL
ncbi:hypothetical protein M5689_019584 [Euphorbia peplus]|nr:hypothetical protein M5689_019584 [Euphorbia peplus]